MNLYVVTQTFLYDEQEIFKGQVFMAKSIDDLPCDEELSPLEFYSEYMAVAKKEE
jgi:hypothetical protein